MEAEADLRRLLPSVEQVLQEASLRPLLERYGREAVLLHLRRLLGEARERAGAGDAAAAAALPERLAERVAKAMSPSLVPILNATGVIVHTNLGRAPLAREAAARVAEVASSYSNLEFDLESGQRGDREDHVEARLRDLVGAEGTVVVNNCAAAVLLAVNTLAEGREVVVSRGELVEIGGSFRIPEVVAKGGGRLREVGTTNRTRLADYRSALGPQTGLLLKVHPSNFRIVGFTEAPTLAQLADLARSAGVPLVEDLGSGLLQATPSLLPGEPTVAESLRAGADVVTWSGDKLLGGPQAGLVAGRRVRVDPMRRNPLYRALRVDKMTLSALDAVLAAHQSGEDVPVLRMLMLTAEDVRRRAEGLRRALRAEVPELDVEVVDGSSAVGGGAAPTLEVPTALVAIAHRSRGAQRLAAALRAGDPPVVVRVAEERVLVDLRTVDPALEPTLLEAIRRAAR